MKIEELQMQIRSHNALSKAGITTVQKLVSLNWKQLNSIPNLGTKSVSEICWNCIQVLNGRVFEEIAKVERVRPDDFEEIRHKAERYDKICRIISEK